MQLIFGAAGAGMPVDPDGFSVKTVAVFEQAILDYHINDSLVQEPVNPFAERTLEYQLYLKSWIDTVQWHVEDEVRRPGIAASYGLELKRRIDRLNQERTRMVEAIDDYFLEQFRCVHVAAGARINSESPAWAVDRLAILLLKIYHMQVEVTRANAPAGHRESCRDRLKLLYEQKADLCQSIDELLEDIALGRKQMKVYRQIKMYNDPQLNPVFYQT
jgi:hypothetical protein